MPLSSGGSAPGVRTLRRSTRVARRYRRLPRVVSSPSGHLGGREWDGGQSALDDVACLVDLNVVADVAVDGDESEPDVAFEFEGCV